MDTKLKNPKIRILLLLLAALILAGATVLLFPRFYNKAVEQEADYFQTYDFAGKLHAYGYGLGYELARTGADAPVDAAALFMPEGVPGGAGLEFTEEGLEDRVRVALNDQINERVSQFYYEWQGLDFAAADSKGNKLESGNADLAALLAGDVSQEVLSRLEEQYTFYALLTYEANGTVTITDTNGDAKTLQEHMGQQSGFTVYQGNDAWAEVSFVPLRAAFGVPRALTGYNPLLYWVERESVETFGEAGLWMVFAFALAAMSVIAIVSTVRRTVGTAVLERMPLELAITTGVLSALSIFPVTYLGFYAQSGQLVLDRTIFNFTGGAALLVGQGLSFIILFLAYAAWFFALASILRITKTGVKAYLLQSVLCVRIVRAAFGWLKSLGRWLVKLGRRIYRDITNFDLNEFGVKTILKLLLINFIILAVVCSLWVFGLFALVVYTVILFFLMRRFARDTSRHYQTLLHAAGDMAKGELNVKIEEDIGIFKPLGEELEKVQQGFKAAVDAETKSQRMKTELVTNVSHDLKTPLTAIITYVDLLKNEDITPEERKKYVEILDRKSQRLKRLIEDLFEMSKANSGNTTLTFTDIDLPALIKQVLSEAEAADAGVEFRNTFPGHPLILRLDGEKTSRIFENLIQNVLKYALSGTRAYITVAAVEGYAVAEIKNISRDELSVDGQELTGRFVRGDAARNTDGSGLGLAIASSFTALQGGALDVQVDGDLFKVTVKFPLEKGERKDAEGEGRNEEKADAEREMI